MLVDATDVERSPPGTDGGCVSGGTDAPSTSTQSPPPSLLLPGGRNWRVPVFGNGLPAIATKPPLPGSYHRGEAAELRHVHGDRPNGRQIRQHEGAVGRARGRRVVVRAKAARAREGPVARRHDLMRLVGNQDV